MYLRLSLRQLCLYAALVIGFCAFLTPGVGAYQIKDGNVMRVMQSGNPGSSASYTINAKMRIEGNGVVVGDNVGAIDPNAIIAPGKGGGSVKYNHVITVCDLETDKCQNVFPSGPDDNYTAYQNCIQRSASNSYDCAEEWAVAEGLLPYEQYLALKGAEEEPVVEVVDATEPVETEEEEELNESLTVEDAADDEFLTSAPKEPTRPLESEIEKVVLDLTTGQRVESAAKKETFVFDLKAGDLVFPNLDYHAAAPQELDREYFSCVRVPGFVIYNDWWEWIAYRLFIVLCLLVIIIFLLAFWVFLLWKKSREGEDNRSDKKGMKHFKKWFLVALAVMSMQTGQALAQVTTTPQLLIYEGELLDDTAVALAGDYSFRFSFWANADFEATDVVAGAINVAAIDYYAWNEVQGQTLDADGRFSFQVGAVTPFVIGMFDQDALYLQVEVKVTGAADSTYEVIDVDAADLLVDRKVIAAVPFAFNANKLDYRDLGYGPGEIPYIDGGTGLLPEAILPALSANGTNDNTFILDQDGNAAAADSLILQFGAAINESLAWNGLTGQFEFSDDVNVGGDLVVTGTINGVTIGPKNVSVRLSPRYPNSIFEKDGTLNSGDMYEELETVLGQEKHVLRWHTDVAGVQQDYDTLVRYTLPHNFSSWQAPGISLDYRTEGGIGDAHVDLRVHKAGSVADEISGTGLDLANAAWANSTFNFAGGTVWAPGDTLWIKMKMHARGINDSHTGDIVLNYVVE